MKAERARPLIKVMNVKTAERAGTNQFQTLHMVNTNKKMTFVWRHPKFYKLATNCRRDNKPQKGKDEQQATSDKPQASSDKRQAPEQEGHEDP